MDFLSEPGFEPWVTSGFKSNALSIRPTTARAAVNACSPSQVLGDVYTEVLEAAHPLHRGPTDHKRSEGPLLSLPEVYNQLFSFAQRKTVVLAPWCKSLYLIQVCGLIIVGNEAQNHSIISKFNNRGGAVRGHAVVGVERVEQGGSGHSPVGLLCSGWWSWRWTGRLSPLEVCRWGNLESSHRVKSLGRGLWDNSQFDGDYSIESWAIVNE